MFFDHPLNKALVSMGRVPPSPFSVRKTIIFMIFMVKYASPVHWNAFQKRGSELPCRFANRNPQNLHPPKTTMEHKNAGVLCYFFGSVQVKDYDYSNPILVVIFPMKRTYLLRKTWGQFGLSKHGPCRHNIADIWHGKCSYMLIILKICQSILNILYNLI